MPCGTANCVYFLSFPKTVSTLKTGFIYTALGTKIFHSDNVWKQNVIWNVKREGQICDTPSWTHSNIKWAMRLQATPEAQGSGPIQSKASTTDSDVRFSPVVPSAWRLPRSQDVVLPQGPFGFQAKVPPNKSLLRSLSLPNIFPRDLMGVPETGLRF